MGLVGFANFPGDRYAVADTEASQLVGGGCAFYGTFTCVYPSCNMATCICGVGMTSYACSLSNTCGGTNPNCGTLYCCCGG
jgi:hypothetical protein